MPLAGSLAGFAIIAVIVFADYNRASTAASLMEKATLTARVIAPNAAAAVWQLDSQAGERILQSLASDLDYASGLIVDDNSNVFASYRGAATKLEPVLPKAVAALLGATTTKGLRIERPLQFVASEDVVTLVPLVIDDKRERNVGYMALSFSRARAAAAAHTEIFAIGAASGVALLVVCALLAWILSHVTRPIRDMTDAMSRLSVGKHDTTIPALDRRDEIGAMARALAVFKENSIERQRLEFVATRLQQTTEELRRNNELVAHLAHHDTLTGLANRAELRQKIEEITAQLKPNSNPFAVFLLDLDRFKEVNDSLGHAAGDALLKTVAQRLTAVVREDDVVARLGGDEFAIIQMPRQSARRKMNGGDASYQAQGLAARILASLAEPFDLGASTAVIGCSIGIALAPKDGVEPDDLMKKADLALYEAKSGGRNCYLLFDAEMMKSADDRLCREAELRAGLARDEFILVYQPVIDVRTYKIVGAEALLRWRHPARGLVTPEHFIPLAEDTGLIVRLGEWVLRQACRDAKAWPARAKLAVNLSALQFRAGNLFDIILSALQEGGLSPNRLEVEVTETVLLENRPKNLALLHQLREIGIAVVLDDFGTGHSSLSYLRNFPFDKIKIDRSFTKDITERADCAAIIASILGLGRSLDMMTTVEGVETIRQIEFIRAAGATLAQGYLFGKPVPASELDFGKLELRGVIEVAV